MKIHLWVYGIFIKENKILLIKKSRWPYKWYLDLPWWKIEFGESIKKALYREFFEETWWLVVHHEYIWNNEIISKYLNRLDEIEDFHHIWLYHKVELNYQKIKAESDWQDSLWCVFIDISELNLLELSPISRPIIESHLLKLK